MAAPPAPEVAWAKELMQPDKMQIMEKEIEKLENRLRLRASSCAYPMACRRARSASGSAGFSARNVILEMVPWWLIASGDALGTQGTDPNYAFFGA
jgi:hypothetical protein